MRSYHMVLGGDDNATKFIRLDRKKKSGYMRVVCSKLRRRDFFIIAPTVIYRSLSPWLFT